MRTSDDAIFVPNEGREPFLYRAFSALQLKVDGTYCYTLSNILQVKVDGQEIRHYGVKPIVIGLDPYNRDLIESTALSLGFPEEKLLSIVKFLDPNKTPGSPSYGTALRNCRRIITQTNLGFILELARGTAAIVEKTK